MLAMWPALAQAEEAVDPGAEARRLFDEGQALFAKGETARACEVFAQSAALERQVGVLLNLARCHATLGRTATAYREFLEAATLADTRGQRKRAKAARALAADLEANLPSLRVQVAGAVAGQTVTVDGETLPPPQLGVARTLDPGEHEIAATAPGHATWRETVSLPNARQVVVVTVPALQAAGPSASMGPLRLAGFVVAGAGAAAAVAGGVLGGLTLSKVSAAEDDPALCPNRVCTPAGREQIDEARGLGIGSTVLLGLGAAAIGAGVVMIVLGEQSDGEQVAVSPWVAPGGAGWSARWRF